MGDGMDEGGEYPLLVPSPARRERGASAASGVRARPAPRLPAWTIGLLAALLLLGISNLQGGLEVVRAHNIGSRALWQWIGVDGALEPYQSKKWYPDEGGWWWWRATRLINTLRITTDASGRAVRADAGADYTITEFPFFSFLLGDLHPHVMALPFGLLGLAVALHVARAREPFGRSWARREAAWLGLAALMLGSLGFLNSWDFPTYTVVLAGAALLAAFQRTHRFDRSLVGEVGWVAGPVALGGVLLFLPFYVGFRSQASGILPVAGPGTRPVHFVIFWGILLFAAVSLLVVEAVRRQKGQARLTAGLPAAALPLAPVALWLVASLALGRPVLSRLPALALYTALAAAPFVLIYRRLRSPATSADGNTLFALLLAGIGFTLALGCELFYVKDVFGTRMNTVFKLYYQAWALLAVAAAFAVYSVHSRWTAAGGVARLSGYAWVAVFAGLVAASVAYPVGSTLAKTNEFAGPATLDGLAFARRQNAAEADAIDWLSRNAPNNAVVVEATGPQYSEFARVATRSGLATLLGWAGHESQWRGTDEAYRGRDQEIDRIYQASDAAAVRAVVEKHGVTYVYFGPLERTKYGAAARDRLARFLDVAFQNAGVTVFQVRAS